MNAPDVGWVALIPPGFVFPSIPLNTLLLLVGLMLVFFGRKLFWLLIATAGFVLGYFAAARFLHSTSDLPGLLVAIGGGVVGALLAVFVQKAAVAIAGILAGGIIFLRAAQVLMAPSDLMMWAFFIAGAIVGLILVTKLLDWSLIFLSSFGGASLVVWELHLGRQSGVFIAVGLTLLGVIVQWNMHSRKARRGKAQASRATRGEDGPT